MKITLSASGFGARSMLINPCLTHYVLQPQHCWILAQEEQMEVPKVPLKLPAERSPPWQCQFVMSEVFDKNLSFLREVFPWKKNQGEKRNQLCFETCPHSVIFILQRGEFPWLWEGSFSKFSWKQGGIAWGLQIFLFWWFLWTALSSRSDVALEVQGCISGLLQGFCSRAELTQQWLRCWCLQGSDTQHQADAQAAFDQPPAPVPAAGRESCSLWSSSAGAELPFHTTIRSSRL